VHLVSRNAGFRVHSVSRATSVARTESVAYKSYPKQNVSPLLLSIKKDLNYVSADNLHQVLADKLHMDKRPLPINCPAGWWWQ